MADAPRTRVSKKGGDRPPFQPTEKQQALLDVMLDPFNRMSTISTICEKAGISRAGYYKMFDDDEFKAHYRKVSIALIEQKRAQLVNIGYREARKGGGAGFGYWKELIKMAQLTDGTDNVQLSGEVKFRFVDPEDDEEDEDDDG